jgi:hypothetical protein
MDAQYCYRYSYSRLKAYNAGTCMHERKMGLAETPRRLPAIAAVCRVSLLRVDWYRNRSLPICRHPCFLLSLLGWFLLRKSGVLLSWTRKPQHLSSSEVTASESQQLHRGSNTTIDKHLFCSRFLHTALQMRMQSKSKSNNTRSRLTAIHTRRQLTQGFPRMEPTDLTTRRVSSFPVVRHLAQTT